MLVPTTISTGIPVSSSTFSAPTCIAPKAPPPLSTTATFLRIATVSGSTGIATADIATATTSNINICLISIFFLNTKKTHIRLAHHLQAPQLVRIFLAGASHFSTAILTATNCKFKNFTQLSQIHTLFLIFSLLTFLNLPYLSKII